MACPMASVDTCYRHPDRTTRVHCTRCGRPICPDCMTPAPVGHHCPVCVGEARQSARRLRPALPRPRSVTTAIIAVNIGVFVLDAILRAAGVGSLLEAGAMIPALVARGEWYRLVTAMFLHVGLFHLALNGFALYVFGGLVEQVLGSARFLGIYLVTGFAGSAVSFAFGDPSRAAVGASGAVFGLLGAWLAYNLRRRSLGLAQANVRWVLMLLAINLAFGLILPRIDWLAHLGGLAAGLVGGFLIEGVGRRAARTASQIGALFLVTAGAGALVAWRATALAG